MGNGQPCVNAGRYFGLWLPQKMDILRVHNYGGWYNSDRKLEGTNLRSVSSNTQLGLSVLKSVSLMFPLSMRGPIQILFTDKSSAQRFYDFSALISNTRLLECCCRLAIKGIHSGLCFTSCNAVANTLFSLLPCNSVGFISCVLLILGTV
ncbi:hypothetical protein TIFTF001_032020 [Ficus carica]|uniref:Uncharacterized protein n=1 Tax=Ficus carica TaxID=3494 RepID=A0AA88E2L8_FICCA|nr:hypothetical protein TIFTF001_031977 [Ficus carica]GMN62939.1 hypothetical protein TIFTF001_032020 [Ficus carica]